MYKSIQKNSKYVKINVPDEGKKTDIMFFNIINIRMITQNRILIIKI